MTTTSPTGSTDHIAAADPHKLVDSSEHLATEAQLHALYGISSGRLRWLRRRRVVRYVDNYPHLPPGAGGADRYGYCVVDIERAKPVPPPEKAPKAPQLDAPPAMAPSPPTVPTLASVRATLHGPAPEIVIMPRRRSS